ncbi:aa3-type cytochrome c oxidase subunit IV [Palleronia rufa]|nr:aa3-type cytochrome c oxidase subunit IV [Palleronia rufa]
MAKHSHGSMDIETQEKTFNGFITWVTRTVIAIIVALILLALING